MVVKEHGLVKPLLEVAAYDFASMLIYLANQIVLKFSMALFFLRIPQRPWQLWSIKISVVVYAIYSFAFFFVVLFECGSPRGFNFVYGHCFHWNIMGPMNYIAASLNAIVDWVFVLTPLVVVSQTMMDRKHKIQVCLLILLGAFGSVISVARIPLISELRIIPSLTYFGRIVPIVALSVSSSSLPFAQSFSLTCDPKAVETSVGLICISLAALRPLVQKTRRNKSTVRSNGSMGNLQHNTGRSGRSRGHIPAGSAFDGKHYELKAGAFHVIEEGDVPLCREEV